MESLRSEILMKIKELIKLAPTNWAKQCGTEMNIEASTVRLIANGKIGKGLQRQIELVDNLNIIIKRQEDAVRARL